jgi:hypothetical protein
MMQGRWKDGLLFTRIAQSVELAIAAVSFQYAAIIRLSAGECKHILLIGLCPSENRVYSAKSQKTEE